MHRRAPYSPSFSLITERSSVVTLKLGDLKKNKNFTLLYSVLRFLKLLLYFLSVSRQMWSNQPSSIVEERDRLWTIL